LHGGATGGKLAGGERTVDVGEARMSTVEEITAAIARLPEDQVGLIRAWLEDRAERRWDEQIEQDERAGRPDALIDRALEEHRAGRTRPL